MAGFFFASSASSSGLSSSSSKSSAIVTAQGDGSVYLDSHLIDHMLPSWQEMESKVTIEFLGRSISYAMNEKHWAWLIIGKSFFCTLEYEGEGIVIHYFKKDRGIKTACSAIMGDSHRVYYDDKYKTSMNFAEILEYVNKVKHSWTSRYYHSIDKNCRDFVRALGKQMDSTFDPPNAVINALVNGLSPFDYTFPKVRSLN